MSKPEVHSSLLLFRDVGPGVIASSSSWTSLEPMSSSKTFVAVKVVRICLALNLSLALMAKAYAVRTILRIWRPLRSWFANSSRRSSSMADGSRVVGAPLSMKLYQSRRRKSWDRDWYLIERWILDLKAGSNVSMRLVVRNMMPS